MQSHGVRKIPRNKERGVVLYMMEMGLCRVVEGDQTIGYEKMILLSSGVIGGVIKEEVAVPVGHCVLKVVKCGGDGEETVLPKVMLKYLNAILARGEGLVGIDSGDVFLDK
jgi:hypothetical protein